MWHVYWIEAPAHEEPGRPNSTPAYVGSSCDVSRRLAQHNRMIRGGAVYTGLYSGWEVVRTVSGFTDKRDCLRFESRLQKAMRRCHDRSSRQVQLTILLGTVHGEGLEVGD